MYFFLKQKSLGPRSVALQMKSFLSFPPNKIPEKKNKRRERFLAERNLMNRKLKEILLGRCQYTVFMKFCHEDGKTLFLRRKKKLFVYIDDFVPDGGKLESK